MYTYTDKRNKTKKTMIITLSLLLLVMVGLMSWSFQALNQKDTPVFNEEAPVITVPDEQIEEKAVRPYLVDAKIVLNYFNADNDTADDVTFFEGSYRPNEGIDYGFNNEEFDVVAIFSGEVTDVKDDSLFGKSVTITSGDLSITYQSLKDTTLKKGDKVNQKDVISKASANIYNKDLNNHVHIVAVKNGMTINPESIYDKALSEIK